MTEKFAVQIRPIPARRYVLGHDTEPTMPHFNVGECWVVVGRAAWR